MALSEWDKKNLTGSQQRAVLSYTEAWERAMRAGDAAAARKAHEGAESIRRLAGYSGGDSGAGFTAAETSAASSTRQTHAQDARRAAEQAAARYAEKQAIDASLVPTRTDADGDGKAGGSGAAQSTWTARFKSGAGTDHSGSGRGFGDTAAGRTTQPGIRYNKLRKEYIINEIETNKGKQFDPKIADVMLRLLRENKIAVEA